MFTWTPKKNRDNKEKHGFYLSDITDVFEDTHALEFYDEGHSSIGDERYIFMGRITETMVLTIIFEDRGEECHLISAREATPEEEKAYNENYKRETG
ncbi:hypothetical protein FACS189461_4810 [Spirochaetia bacterium]|nr:hypothetical protein FACS189461_4810 [Spirochaetia bacterium]